MAKASASSPASLLAEASTRERILDVAEALFAEHGFAGATMRRITQAAEVNLAAVNYHFGDKAELYREVFIRRIRPMNTQRLSALATAESAAGRSGASIPLRTLLEILARPIADLIDTAGGDVHPFVRVMARNLVEPQPFMEKVIVSEFGPMLAVFSPHLLRQLPHLDRPALLWRARFIIGAANVTFGRMQIIERRLRELGAPTDGDTILRELVTFAEAGLSAPATGSVSS